MFQLMVIWICSNVTVFALAKAIDWMGHLYGTPTLVVNHKITRALIKVQKKCSLRYSLQLTCFLLAVNTWLNRSTLQTNWSIFWLGQVHKPTKTRQNCSFRGHSRLHARRRFIGALVPEALMGFVKLGYFLPLPRYKHLWCKWKKIIIHQEQWRTLLTTVVSNY